MESEPAAGFFVRAKEALARAGRAAARAQAAALLTLAYFLVIGPAALLARALGADPLSIRRAARTGWIARRAGPARETLTKAG